MAGIAVADANALVSAEVRAISYTGPAVLYMSLHTADPGSSGASELSGGSYTRQQVSFSAPSGGTASNAATLSFTGLPAATITHASLWDALTSGNFRQSGALAAPQTVSAGNTLQFAAGGITYQVTAV